MTWAIFLPVAGIAALAGGAANNMGPESQAQGPEPNIVRAPLVVIDPGHGGRNSGATYFGREEKDVTLAIAKRLVGHLESRGVRCMLTRNGDDYLTLRQRTQLANEHHADRFISIHANAGSGRNQGFETYVLSLKGTEIDAPALRRGQGAPRIGVDPEAAALLDAVEQGVAVDRAASWAEAIQRELANTRGPRRSRGVRQESHHVLLGATMPAVLVEVGFMDHPTEARELHSSAVQDNIAEALAQATLQSLR